MATTPSCLTGLLGLSAAGSTCFPLPVPTVPGADNAYITASASGLYVDRVEGLNLRPAQGQSPGSNVYARLDQARSQALLEIETELSRAVAALYTEPVLPLLGQFGDLGDGTLRAEGQQPLLRLPTKDRPGRGYALRSLLLYASATVTDVPVLLDGAQIATLTTNAEYPAELPKGLVVPLDGLVHTLTAVLPEGVRARQNALTCGCSPQHPAVALGLYGLRGDEGRPDYQRKAWAGGFVVQLETTCTADSPLCFALSQDEELARSVAFALQYRTAQLLVTGFMADAAYSRYTSLEPKAMQALLELYAGKCQEHLVWLSGAGGIQRVPNPCFCPPSARYAPRYVR